MCGVGIHLDFRRQIRFGEGLFQNNLVIGRSGIVICGDRDEELRLAFGSLKMRAIWLVCHESAAME